MVSPSYITMEDPQYKIQIKNQTKLEQEVQMENKVTAIIDVSKWRPK
jgi:hypothetical protein